MTDYKAISGNKIKFLTSDLSMSSATEGELFYSDTSKEFKVGVTVAAWSSGGNMNTTRRGGNSTGIGTQTAALSAGGVIPPGPQTVNVEEYDGSSWSEQSNISSARQHCGGAGTQTAGLIFGGDPAPNGTVTQEYDGSSWTAGGDIATTWGCAGFGTQTAGLAASGLNPGDTNLTTSYEYDGSSWTSGGTVNTGRRNIPCAGTQTAGVIMGGYVQGGASLANVEEYDGSSWAEVTDVPTANNSHGGGTGTQTAALLCGGSPARTHSFKYDGTNFSSYVVLSTGRSDHYCGGTQVVALVAGGDPGLASSEELTETVTLKTITDS